MGNPCFLREARCTPDSRIPIFRWLPTVDILFQQSYTEYGSTRKKAAPEQILGTPERKRKKSPLMPPGNAGGCIQHREEILRMLNSLSPSADDSYFGNKKILVTYALLVLVFWIHISTFYNYGPYPPALDFLIIFLQSVASRAAVPRSSFCPGPCSTGTTPPSATVRN